MGGFPSLLKRLFQCIGVLAVFAFQYRDFGGPIDHATITEVVNDVKVMDPQARNAVPAETNILFRSPQIMKTGAESRSEMLADDETITRVGANTLFSFEPHERIINLKQGSVLFQSPPGRGGGTIRTDAATASVLGTTIIAVATRDGGFKLLVLEGKARVRMPDGTVTLLHGGQMVFVRPRTPKLGPPLDFYLREEVATSELVNGFQHQLPTWRKIDRQIVEQEEQFNLGNLVVATITDPNIRINRAGVFAPTPVPLPTPIRTVASRPPATVLCPP